MIRHSGCNPYHFWTYCGVNHFCIYKRGMPYRLNLYRNKNAARIDLMFSAAKHRHNPSDARLDSLHIFLSRSDL